MSRLTLSSKTGKLFSKPLVVIGYVTIVLSVAIAISSPPVSVFIGFLFFMTGAFFATSHTGIKLRPVQKEVMHYTSIIGYKKGVYRNYDDYPYITVIKKNKGPLGHELVLYEIYLLSKSHKGKVLLHLSKSESEASVMLEKLADAFGVQKVEYDHPMAIKNGRKHTSMEKAKLK